MPSDTDQPPAPQSDPEHRTGGATFRILSLIGTGHAVSNFYALCLPPLIPFLKAEFDVSYAALGVMLSLRSFMSGIMQMPMGIAVDKLGAKPVLVAGSILMGASFALIAVSPGYWTTMVLLACLGAGMATLRPSNYAIINASIPRPWLGRAFGFNVFSAHAGRAVAPAAIIFLVSLWDWRIAVLIAGGTGILITTALITQWRHVRDDTKVERKGPGPGFADQARMFASKGIVLFFAFYALTSFSMQGVLSFSVVAMTELGRAPLGAASGALTGYLIASALGVLLGGYLADKTSRHELMAVSALMLSAGFLLALGIVSMPVVLIVVVMSTVGMCQGAMRPARDMLLRAILPREIFGRAIGLVSTGAAIGGTLSPVIFGWILDLGHPEWVFYILGASITLVAGTIIVPKERIRLPG